MKMQSGQYHFEPQWHAWINIDDVYRFIAIRMDVGFNLYHDPSQSGSSRSSNLETSQSVLWCNENPG